MKHWGILLLLLASPAFAGDKGAIQSWGAEYFEEEVDHSKFYHTKNDIKAALVEAVQRHLAPNVTEAILQEIVKDLQLKIITMKATGVPLDYMLHTQFVKDGTALLTLRVNYTDDVSSIDWEFQTITDGTVAAFFSRTGNGKAAESMEEYYRWEMVHK